MGAGHSTQKGQSRSAAQPGQVFLKSAHTEESNQVINKSNHHAAINTHPGILQDFTVLPLEPYFVIQSLSWESLFLSVGHSG